MTTYTSIKDALPDDYEYVIAKCKGANVKAIFIIDEQNNPLFIHFDKRGRSRILTGVDSWISDNGTH